MTGREGTEVTLHGGQSQQNSNVDLGQSCQSSQAKSPRAALRGWAPRLGSVSGPHVPPEKMCRGWKPSPSQLLLTASPLTISHGCPGSSAAAAAAAKSLQLCPTLCDPIDGSPPGSLSLGFSRQEHWSGLPFPFPMHQSEK